MCVCGKQFFYYFSYFSNTHSWSKVENNRNREYVLRVLLLCVATWLYSGTLFVEMSFFCNVCCVPLQNKQRLSFIVVKWIFLLHQGNRAICIECKRICWIFSFAYCISICYRGTKSDIVRMFLLFFVQSITVL